MTKLNRFIEWNEDSGELVAESGALLSDVIETFLPFGWFPYVTPGTKFVTLGGAIASDVHGKNHHLEGSFGNYVNWIEIIDETNRLSESQQAEEGESSKELGDAPQTGDGGQKKEGRKQVVEQLDAGQLLLDPALNDMWLRQVQKDPALFLANKFQIQNEKTKETKESSKL